MTTDDNRPAGEQGDVLHLDAHDQRVLGVLLEKERTVPATYPLSLNALRAGCNQASSREPVVDWSEEEIRGVANSLRRRDLLWIDHGDRVLKYRQLLDIRLGLDEEERAILTVLLLRGPQAPGELRTRTDRLHAFADRSDVESVLHRMAARNQPLVAELPRSPGDRDHRWAHLLGDAPAAGVKNDGADGAGAAAYDRESVLGQGAAARDGRVRTVYDAVAGAYLERLGSELGGKPFDRWLLGRVPDLAGAAGGPVVDVGCGPGHVTEFLRAAGAEVSGLDLSDAMIELAGAAFPGIPFETGDFARLMRPRSASAWGAIVGWYAAVHLAASELAPTFAVWQRVLAPGGWVALALHVGRGVHHVEQLLGVPVEVDFVLHDPEEVRAALAQAGLDVREWYVRGPMVEVEAPTERLYVLAQRPV